MRPEIQRLLELVDPKDRIRFDDIKPNQLVWFLTGVYGLYQIVGLGRYYDHWHNPYTSIINQFLIYKEKHNPTFNEELSFGAKDKLFRCTYYVANDTVITLMGLQYAIKIPSEIDPVKVRQQWEEVRRPNVT